jgi:hypothetical protein
MFLQVINVQFHIRSYGYSAALYRYCTGTLVPVHVRYRYCYGVTNSYLFRTKLPFSELSAISNNFVIILFQGCQNIVLQLDLR